MTRDEAWRAYVAAYPVEVSEEAIQNEFEYIKLDMRHRMQYDRMSGGNPHFFADMELQEQEEELRAAAEFEAKEPLVLRELVAKLGLDVTQEELEAEAQALAERQQTTLESVKLFFGEDFTLLRRDVLNNKAIDWAIGQ